jgi:hypothetical protein
LKTQCKIPNHKVHVTNFVKKYPTAKGRVSKTIILVDPKDWAVVLDNPALNTTECCQICSIAEGIAQAEKEIGTTGRTSVFLSVEVSRLMKLKSLV